MDKVKSLRESMSEIVEALTPEQIEQYLIQSGIDETLFAQACDTQPTSHASTQREIDRLPNQSSCPM